MIRNVRASLLLAALLAASGCGVFKASKPKTPVLGQRVPILVSETGAEVDPALAAIDVLLPPVVVNDAWAQTGGNAAHAMGHLGLGASPTRAWEAKIAGSSTRARLAAGPVVAGGRVYAVDTDAQLHAFDAATGREVWAAFVGDSADNDRGSGAKRNARSLFGGGVSVEGDRLFATNGLGDVVAFNAADGAVVWRKRPGGPLRGAPTLSNGNLYVVSQDNQLYALRQSDGNVEWTEAGTLEVSGVFGVAAPAAAQGTVVAGFSSGELTAYRYENGRPVWQDALSRTSISTSVGTISDIDADPVVDQGRVFAIGSGGRMVALELVTGQRVWEINAGGISTPWIAGEWLFAVTDDARLLAVARSNGRVRWATQLKRWRNAKSKKGPVSWVGPVLAGNRLITVSSEGDIVYVTPGTGAVEATVDYGRPVSLAPAVASNTLFLLDDQGRLTAWR
ncbi:PQQ-binding-like beta-propeller repeat protein [Sphingomonas sp. ID1715]|uniref:PQQ-like beta-propeller repeat protein n=1 Tax=Sphingomonas sp. ID1715 TaxID=1656898 RepID=UPI00148809E3|nr:PQQ-binding-like beta-propeller repeat protein [Sphingomonas sp. ID1715]NNM75963.1 PQQ-binding-like beta-propeller repeat protein [Sphingomonas sp. ID1715]